jgi:uncharacterized protein (DUF1697 family)
MTRYVALLRGISPTNPNMRNFKLKAIFKDLGFSKVETLLTSGNVIFDSESKYVAELESRIEKAITINLGFNSTTIIRSQEQINNIVKSDPFHGQEQNKENYLIVTFFKQKTEVPFNLPYTPENKAFTLISNTDTAIYVKVDLTKGKTPDYMTWLEKHFGKAITSRTWKTTERIKNTML